MVKQIAINIIDVFQIVLQKNGKYNFHSNKTTPKSTVYYTPKGPLVEEREIVSKTPLYFCP